MNAPDLPGRDPDAKVTVFIDGQNLYNACRRLFGHPLCHPHLLAEHLAGPRPRNRVGVRFYTGRPNPNVPGEAGKTQSLDRRLDAMRRHGVTVVTRQLRYHWDWGHREPLPRAQANAEPQTVTLRPWQRPQEKGIDLVIALDVIESILTGVTDVAILVSLDRDLYEIPQALQNLRQFVDRPVRLEAAVPVPGGRNAPKTLLKFAYTHQLTPEVFELVRDDTRYNAPAQDWNPPDFPRTLAERADRQA